MQALGLRKADLRAYHAALADDHTRVIGVDVLDLDEHPVASITPVVLDGQIVVDTKADVTRKLTMTFLDPHHQLQFDADSPADGALYRDRMLRVSYTILVAALGRHVTAVPFTGVVTRFQRDGAVVSVEADGKERLGLGQAWRPMTRRKGTPLLGAVRDIMTDRAGEHRFAFPVSKATLPKNVTLDRMNQPFKVAHRVAASRNRQLVYPGHGRLTLRRLPNRPVFTFRTGPGGMVLADPETVFTIEKVANVVWVLGRKPKGSHRRVQHVAVAPAKHPMSPVNLGRNGVPHRIVERVQNPHFKTEKDCREHAERVLEDRLRGLLDVRFDSMPVPHLDEGDVCRLVTPSGTVRFRLQQFSIPLGTEGVPPMTVGYHRRTTRYPRRKRR
jgi:hypothetical protein